MDQFVMLQYSQAVQYSNKLSLWLGRKNTQLLEISNRSSLDNYTAF